MEKLNEIIEMFENVFRTEAEELKLKVLIKQFGIEKVDAVLSYLTINGVSEPGEGKRNNPYGLIYKMCQVWKI